MGNDQDELQDDENREDLLKRRHDEAPPQRELSRSSRHLRNHPPAQVPRGACCERRVKGFQELQCSCVNRLTRRTRRNAERAQTSAISAISASPRDLLSSIVSTL